MGAEEQETFVESFRAFLDEVVHVRRADAGRPTPLGEVVAEHLGVPLDTLPLLAEHVPAHRLVDADIALEAIAGEGPEARLLGVTGGMQREHEDFPQLLTNPYAGFAPGPVDYVSMSTGPETARNVVAFGVRLFTLDGEPVAVLQRGARPDRGRETASLELLARTPETGSEALARIRREMQARSVLRGQVLSLSGGEMYGRLGGVTFLPRPEIPADAVVLPPGTLDRVSRHVLEVGRLGDRLREQGQHLKRGLLLYGPPGTGKTLTIRHLLGRTPGVTCILLTGSSVQFIAEAADLARSMQPSMLVIEDVDLIAAEREMFGGPQPLLYAVLDALDGLEGDADVAFVLSTNRADLLEPALAERPGRVDLAVEIPLPDPEARRRLFALYAAGLPLSQEAIDSAARIAEGVTGSFAKELIRRAVLRAAIEDRPVQDADLGAALDELMDSSARLTRGLLGSSS